MEWTDDGIVLTTRAHGESASVAVLLTEAHGRHAGLVHGARSGRNRGVLQAGNRVRAAWRARLAEHLGNYTCEGLDHSGSDMLEDAMRLAGLMSACAVADKSLPEREPHPNVYYGLGALIDTMANPDLGDAWIAVYVRWELGLLADLGFGLDLTTCAATGAKSDLVYVSPRSGRAVSREGGAAYRDKLLALPGFLTDITKLQADDLADDFRAGLALTGYFLDRHVFGAHHQEAPAARSRFIERLRPADRAGLEKEISHDDG